MAVPAALMGTVLSAVARYSVDQKQDLVPLVVDHAVLALCFVWIPSAWAAVPFSFVAFLALAFYKSRAEYMRPEDSHREEHSLLCPVLGTTPSPTASGRPPSPPPGHPGVPRSTVSRDSSSRSSKDDEPKELYGTPMLFPCDLRHRRIAPFKDGFRHSYLYCGMPVGLHATYSPLLTIDQPTDPASKWPFRRSWFSLRAEDHAIRGGAQMTMAQKLREFLLSEGADPNEWAYAYLLAVPCVNGQVDNPLGFWYLYSADKKLTAIITELNTSYGERRLWLVRQQLPPKSSSDKTSATSPYVFRGRFHKDIHVSPFMPSTGWYIVDTSDPCAPSKPGQLDILVTLASPDNKPLMVTRVTSTQPGLDVPRTTMWERISFVLKWWYVATCTVMTYRILSHAARIYFLKATQYWTRPEPLKTALGKPARTVERTIEKAFRRFLQHTVENHPTPVSVTYLTPGEHSKKTETFHSLTPSKPTSPPLTLIPPTPPLSPTTPPSSPPHLTFQVINPIFYSRLVHYPTVHAALRAELLDDARTRTTWSSDGEAFAALFSPTLATAEPLPDEKYPPGSRPWQWRLSALLRGKPVTPNFPRQARCERFEGLSELDRFVVSEGGDAAETRRYRRAVLRVFVGMWIGGVQFGPLRRFSDDFEPWGVSREALVMIWEAAAKAAVVGRVVVGGGGWGVVGWNLWEVVKVCV